MLVSHNSEDLHLWHSLYNGSIDTLDGLPWAYRPNEYGNVTKKCTDRLHHKHEAVLLTAILKADHPITSLLEAYNLQVWGCILIAFACASAIHGILFTWEIHQVPTYVLLKFDPRQT